MTTPAAPPANWYADPLARFELRYWDGTRWTEHVSAAGQQHVDPLEAAMPQAAPSPTLPTDEALGGFGGIEVGQASMAPDRVQDQVQRQAGVTGGEVGGGTPFTENVLVVNQKAKLFELVNEYAIFDRNGTRIGAVRQVGQSTGRKVLRLVSNVDQFLKHRFELTDSAGAVLLEIERPGKVFKSTVIVSRPGSGEVGRLVQENVFGKIRFGLVVADRKIGSLNAENWRAWNFAIRDENENEVARVTKTWEGLAKAMFTTADNYVLEITQPLSDPLHSLVVAAAVTIDTALKQDSRGLG